MEWTLKDFFCILKNWGNSYVTSCGYRVVCLVQEMSKAVWLFLALYLEYNNDTLDFFFWVFAIPKCLTYIEYTRSPSQCTVIQKHSKATSNRSFTPIIKHHGQSAPPCFRKINHFPSRRQQTAAEHKIDVDYLVHKKRVTIPKYT